MSHRLEYDAHSVSQASHSGGSSGAPSSHDGNLQSNVFTYSLEERLKGMSGVPSWVRRARELEDAEDHFWKQVEARWKSLQEADLLPGEFARAWSSEAQHFDYARLQAMVEHYNEYYPIEARLPINPLTGEYMMGEAPFQPKLAPTLTEVLGRFPALN